MKRKYAILLRGGIGLAILGALIYLIRFEDIVKTIVNIKPPLLLLLLSYFVPILLTSALNIWLLAKALGIKILPQTALKYFLLGWSVGLFSPGRIGEISFAHFIKKEGVDYGAGASIVVADKLITLTVLAIIASAGSFLLLPITSAIQITAAAIVLLFGLAVFLLSNKLRDFIKKFVLKRYAAKFRGFSKNIQYIFTERRALVAGNLLLTITRISIGALILSIVFKALGFPISPIVVMSIGAIGTISTLIPVSISGLGVKESIVALLYSQAGVAPAVAVSVYLFMRSAEYILGGSVIIISLLLRKS